MANSGTDRSAREAGSELVGGRVLGGRYRLETEIGRGAMGVVWSAVDLGVSREVALKIVAEPDANLRRRLSREGRVCKELRHPNVAEVHDIGETAAGQPFLVMQRLHGETLADSLARTPRLPEASAAAIALDIARALTAAHAVGVVHRDLKPANVFLHRAPGVREVVVKVLDFGVCKVQEPGDDLRTELGAPVGSLAYMAPEQAAGEADIDGRADLWSLGAVLFEMLAGRRLFQGSRMNLIRQLLYDPLPSFASELRGADPGVVTVVARCLAREREERWATASDVAAALSDACLRAEQSEGPRTRVSFSRADLPSPAAPAEPNAHAVSEPTREGRPSVPRSATLVLGPPRLESWPDDRVRSPAPAAPAPAPRESFSSLPGEVVHGPAWGAPPSPPRDLRQAPSHVGAVTVRMSGEEALRSAAEGLSAPGFAAFAVAPPPPPAAPRSPTVAGSPALSGLAALPSWFAAASAVALVVVLGVILFLMS